MLQYSPFCLAYLLSGPFLSFSQHSKNERDELNNKLRQYDRTKNEYSRIIRDYVENLMPFYITYDLSCEIDTQLPREERMHISWLEQGASGHPKPEKSNIINYDTITIEHISPQSPSGTSIFTGDDIHKLKNLTLLTPPENDLAANKDYAAKKPIYVNSTYKLNTFFESIDTWNVRASEQWETHLIDMACKIFVV